MPRGLSDQQKRIIQELEQYGGRVEKRQFLEYLRKTIYPDLRRLYPHSYYWILNSSYINIPVEDRPAWIENHKAEIEKTRVTTWRSLDRLIKRGLIVEDNGYISLPGPGQPGTTGPGSVTR